MNIGPSELLLVAITLAFLLVPLLLLVLVYKLGVARGRASVPRDEARHSQPE